MKKLHITPFSAFLFSFLSLLTVNIRHLTDPPYWDALLGVYTQGVWLYRNGFNYLLLMRQPSYIDGGAKVHLWYIFALLFGVLNRLFTPPGVFLCLHILILTAASVCVVAYFQILSSQMTLFLSILWVIAAASNPIWSGQVASLYLEIPMSALLSISIYFFWKKNYKRASIWCLLAYFIKSAAVLPAAIYALFSLGCLGVYQWRRTAEPVDRTLSYLLFPAPLMLLLDHWTGARVYSDPFVITTISQYVVRTIRQIPYLYPTLAIEMILIIGLLAIAIGHRVKSSDSIIEDMRDRSWALFLAIFTVGFWGCFMITRHALVRYTVMVQWPMIALLALLLANYRRLSAAVGGLLLLLNLLNQHGQSLASLPSFVGRSGDRLERSREYLTDLAADRRLCKWLEDQAAGEPIVTKWPFTQMLRIPELGYVRRPLPIIIEATTPSLLAKAYGWEDLHSLAKNHQTLCLYAPTVFENEGPSLQPRKGDILLWADTSLPAPLFVFRRRWINKEEVARAAL